MTKPDVLPLTGTVVLDLTRMLPGAVASKMLVDLGARVIKIEDPAQGDPMRSAPPLLEGVSTGYRAFFSGTESVCLDLRTNEGVSGLRQLAASADVLIESFRPGTLERWGCGYESLSARNDRLIMCSISGFGCHSSRAAHDLNLMGLSGLLASWPRGVLPAFQMADVTAGLLAASALMAALLQRARTGRGMVLDQPIATGPLPFLTWAWANMGAAQSQEPLIDTLLVGQGGAYGAYRCGDGLWLVVATIEPKFWGVLLEGLGLTHLLEFGLAVGEDGARVRSSVAEAFCKQPRAHWLAFAEQHGLPISALNEPADGYKDPAFKGLQTTVPLPSGAEMQVAGPFLPSFTGPQKGPTPRLGADTERVLREFGASVELSPDL